jgi:RNA polymerase sigma-70 factor, ECF subfamily
MVVGVLCGAVEDGHEESGDAGGNDAHYAVLYADSGGKAMAPQEPLFGAAQIARFMAAVAQARPPSGEFENRRVRVNGQPGRLVRGPAERQLGEAERLAADKALALLRSGDVDADEFAELVKGARDAAGGRTTGAVSQQQPEVRVWSVLTVDVVEGRIQTVRIVRNPDKLGHL